MAGLDAEDEDEEALAAAIALSLSIATPTAPELEPEPEPEPPAPAPERPPPLKEYLETHAPDILVCPIAFSLMHDPVVLAADGCTYSHAAIEAHFNYCRGREFKEGGGGVFVTNALTLPSHHTKHPPTGGQPLTSPKTNLAIMDAADARLIPNVLARGQVSDYKVAKQREWEELEQRWQAWAAAGQEEKQKG